MKNFLKGALLASSLLGAYAVADEVMHPTTQVAEASLLDSLKSEAKKKNCAYSNLDWIYQPEGKCTFVKTSDGIMDVYGHHPKAKGKVIDTGAVFEAEDGKKGYISKYDLPKKCQEDFYEYGDNATFYIKCSNNKIYEYRNFGWTDVGLWYLDEDNEEWNYGADDGKFTRSSLSSSTSHNSSTSISTEMSYSEPSKTYSYKGQLTPIKYSYRLFTNKQFSKTNGYLKEGHTYYAKGYFYYYTNFELRRYYSLYQKDSKGKYIWRGYADGNALTKVKTSKINQKVMMTGKSYSRWKDLYFSRKIGTVKKVKYTMQKNLIKLVME